jgi:feruloyl esterase
MRLAGAVVFAVVLTLFAVDQRPGSAAAPTAASSCEQLAALTLPHAKIESAETVAAGTFTPPPPARGADPAGAAPAAGRGGGRGAAINPYEKLPAFCRVRAVLTPTSDSDIKAEVWLPASGWNGKYQAVAAADGPGRFRIPLANAAGGYATASTDTGHTGGTADFARPSPESSSTRLPRDSRDDGVRHRSSTRSTERRRRSPS